MFTRTLTGLSLGLVVVFALLWRLESAVCLLLVIMLLCAWEWCTHFLMGRSAWVKSVYAFWVLIFLSVAIYLATNPSQPLHYLYLITPLSLVFIFSACMYVISSNFANGLSNDWHSGVYYICLPITTAIYFLQFDFGSHKWVVLLIIFMNWGNDILAYMVGRVIGRRRLAPSISPQKTVEGFFAGLAGSLAFASVLNHFILPTQLSTTTVCATSVAVWILGTLGDLYESKLKRSIGIKDSGNLLPGHGGFLDRFDSFLFIIPTGIVSYLLLRG